MTTPANLQPHEMTLAEFSTQAQVIELKNHGRR